MTTAAVRELPCPTSTDDARSPPTRYLQALTVLDDESVRRPSLLPGWTRAHVVAHLCPQRRRVHPGAARQVARRRAGLDVPLEERATPTSRSRRDQRPRRAARGRAAVRRAARRRRPPGCDADRRTRRHARVRRATAPFPRRAVSRAARLRGGGDPPRRPRRRLHPRRLAGRLLAARWSTRRQGELRRPEAPVEVLAPPTSTGSGRSATGRARRSGGTAGDLAWWLVGRGGGRGLTCSTRRAADRSEGVSMSYHGKVTPGGPPDVRELAHLTITKVAVERDGQQLLPAALPAHRRAGAHRRRRRAAPAARAHRRRRSGAAWSPRTSTGTTTGPSPRSSRPPAPRPSPAPTTPTRSPGRPGRLAGVGDGDTVDGRRLHARGDPPRRPHARLDRAAVRRPRRHSAPVHRRLAVPRRGRQHLRRPDGLRVA